MGNPQIGQNYRVKNKAAIDLQCTLNVNLIAALLCIPYTSLICGDIQCMYTVQTDAMFLVVQSITMIILRYHPPLSTDNGKITRGLYY